MKRSERTVPPDGMLQEDQPKWRNDFPIDLPQDEYVSRRDFTKFLILISFAFVVGQFWIVVQNFWRNFRGRPSLMKITDLDQLPPGNSLVFQYPKQHDPCVLVRTSEGEFVAYSQKCTHLSCPVIVKMADRQLHCPCHEGSFDLSTGRALAGPPRRPLPRVRLQVRGNSIYADGMVDQA